MNTDNLPVEPPAVGGWYFDEKANKPRFLMPPYPGVDDAVMTPAGLAYRKLAARDHHNELRAYMYEEYQAALAVLRVLGPRDLSPEGDELFQRQQQRCTELKNQITAFDSQVIFTWPGPDKGIVARSGGSF